MKSKKSIITFLMIFTAVIIFSFENSHGATSKTKGSQSGASLFGGNSASTPKPASKPAAEKSEEPKKSLFSTLFGSKKTPAKEEKVEPEVHEEPGQAELVLTGPTVVDVSNDYSGNWDQAPPISPSYGNVTPGNGNATSSRYVTSENHITSGYSDGIQSSDAARRATSTRVSYSDTKKASSSSEAPLPGEDAGYVHIGRNSKTGRANRSAPPLTLPKGDISVQAQGELSNRLLSPTWDVLEKPESLPEPAPQKQERISIYTSESPLPPLPDQEVMEMPGQTRIGRGISSENLPIRRMEISDDELPPLVEDYVEGSMLPPGPSLGARITVTEAEQGSRERLPEFRPGNQEELPEFRPEPNRFRVEPTERKTGTGWGEQTARLGGNDRGAAITPSASRNSAKERPIIEINTVGPEKIAVGTRVVYEIDIKNSGNFMAEDIVVNVKIPTWVEVAHAAGTAGSFDLKKVADQDLFLGEWSVGDIPVNRQEKLTLTVISTARRPFDLDVTWKSQQTSTQTSVMVEEPKLELELIGTQTAILGRAESFTLKIHNVGTCVAEETSVFVLSDEEENFPAIAQNMGNLAPGETRTHTVQYLAKKQGSANFRVKVTTRSGTEVTAEKPIKIQYSELHLRVEPVPPQYVGVDSAYRLFISNSGTAVTTGAKMELRFPQNMELISSVSHAHAEQGKVSWELGNISPGETREFSVTLRPTVQGDVSLRLTADSKFTAPVALDIPVVCHALANMQIELQVPEKPLLVNETGEYFLKVKNTGSESVRDARIYFFFPEEMVPQPTPGAFLAGDGVIAFDAQTIVPGESRTFTVYAKGALAGKHSVRAQVKSESKQIDLLEQRPAFFR